MKIHAIVRNEDTKIAMSLVGIDSVCVYTPKELEIAYTKALSDKEIAIIALENTFFEVLENNFQDKPITIPIGSFV